MLAYLIKLTKLSTERERNAKLDLQLKKIPNIKIPNVK